MGGGNSLAAGPAAAAFTASFREALSEADIVHTIRTGKTLDVSEIRSQAVTAALLEQLADSPLLEKDAEYCGWLAYSLQGRMTEAQRRGADGAARKGPAGRGGQRGPLPGRLRSKAVSQHAVGHRAAGCGAAGRRAADLLADGVNRRKRPAWRPRFRSKRRTPGGSTAK